MAKPNRNDPCHCGSGKKYKNCHLEADEAVARQERASAAATAAAANAVAPPTDADGNILPPPMDANMPSKPLGPSYWMLAPIGLALVIGVSVFKGVGAGLSVAAAWALGMVAWAVIRDPPPPKPRSEIPPGMNFGRTPEERQSGIIRTQPPRNRPRTRR